MVPDFVNKFTSKNDASSENVTENQTDAAAEAAAGKEMEDILKDSVNKQESQVSCFINGGWS